MIYRNILVFMGLLLRFMVQGQVQFTNVSVTSSQGILRVCYDLLPAQQNLVLKGVRMHIVSPKLEQTITPHKSYVSGAIGANVSFGTGQCIEWKTSANGYVFMDEEVDVQLEADFESKFNFEPETVLVEGGTFKMGSNDYNDDEKPVHNVTVSSFRMGKYEVTQAQWQAVMENNPSYFTNCDNCPVERVSWDDIQDFISELNGLTGKRYRLPTEAEWEFAARGGNKGNKSKGYTYSGSNNIGDVAWFGDNSESKTHPVGGKKANELGIYDMSGNVWEWCSDRYGRYRSAVNNPTGATTGAVRVIRGGSYYHTVPNSRVASRLYNTPSDRFSAVGFRLVLSLQ